jgi:CHAD domain-containing protein
VVAAAVGLHNAPPPWTPPASGAAARAAWRVTALLRVADALDHGHLQDARIAGAARRGAGLALTVAFRRLPANAARAESRADLWRRVFGQPLAVRALRERSRGPRGLYRGVLLGDESLLEAARRLLCVEFLVLRGALARGPSGSEPLHDARVALRRFGRALRLVRGLRSGSKPLCRGIARLADRLGPARDEEAWVAFLREPGTRRLCRGAAGWKRYVTAVRSRALRLAAGAWAELRSAPTRDLLRDMERFVRVDLPGREARKGSEPFRAAARRALRKEMEKLARASASPASLPPEGLHRLRRRVRRARYLAEFAAPALGRCAARLAVELKAGADALGRVHDMDVRLAGASSTRYPTALRGRMLLVREEGLRAAEAPVAAYCRGWRTAEARGGKEEEKES